MVYCFYQMAMSRLKSALQSFGSENSDHEFPSGCVSLLNCCIIAVSVIVVVGLCLTFARNAIET